MGTRSARPVPPTVVDANRLWVDSRLRALVQRRIEAAVLRRLGGQVPGGRVLELGTGRRGTGLRLALEVFGAEHADGVDRFDDSAAACREAVRDLGARVEVRTGDAGALAVSDASYDAVFGYHVLHHAEAWRDVVGEAARLLRPGGRLYSCEMTARFGRQPGPAGGVPPSRRRRPPDPGGDRRRLPHRRVDRDRPGDPAGRLLDRARGDPSLTPPGPTAP